MSTTREYKAAAGTISALDIFCYTQKKRGKKIQEWVSDTVQPEDTSPLIYTRKESKAVMKTAYWVCRFSAGNTDISQWLTTPVWRYRRMVEHSCCLRMKKSGTNISDKITDSIEKRCYFSHIIFFIISLVQLLVTAAGTQIFLPALVLAAAVLTEAVVKVKKYFGLLRLWFLGFWGVYESTTDFVSIYLLSLPYYGWGHDVSSLTGYLTHPPRQSPALLGNPKTQARVVSKSLQRVLGLPQGFHLGMEPKELQREFSKSHLNSWSKSTFSLPGYQKSIHPLE